MRLGIMGGTFDPIHYGHLFVAEDARLMFKLDRVIFIPNGIPPHKQVGAMTTARHRYAMTLIATHNNPTFVCSPMEVQRSGPSYTIDTLHQLRRENPLAELFYITGVDAIAEMMSWKSHEDVIQLAQFVAATRPGFALNQLRRRLPMAYLQRILPLNTTAVNLSSTMIRDRRTKKLPVRYLTPDGVVNYIYQHKIYGDSPPPETGENY